VAVIKNAILVTCLLASVSTVAADESVIRDRIKKESEDLFRANDYAGLESIAARYRANGTRTPSGLLMLPLFYLGVADVAPEEGANRQAWKSVHDAADRWLAQYPNSPTPYIAKSHILLRRAWAYRGTSYASDVGLWNMLRFKQEAKKARDVLLARDSLTKSDPEFYTEILSTLLATGDREEDYRAYLDEGLTKYPDYDALYFRALVFHDPRWGGSENDIARFAAEAVGRTSEARGLEMYARIYWSAGQRRSGGFYFQNPPADWTKMRAGIRDLVNRYPDQWNINHLAFFACIRKDAEVAGELLEMLVEPIVESAWHSNRNYEGCKNWLLRINGGPD